MNEDRLLAGARTVHVRIALAPEDNASMNNSLPPVLVDAPFYSNTDMLAETAYKSFKAYLPPLMGRSSKDVDDWAAAWFTLQGVVVSGRQIPLGVLSTYMAPSDQAPLEVVVHFSKAYPPQACPFRAASRSQQHLIFNPRHMYFNSLKEAVSILTGKGQQVPFMMPDSWREVWAAAREGDLQRHSDSIHRCKTPLDSAPCLRSGQAEIQIPLRILVCQGLCKERFYSRPAAVQRHDGSRPTLMDTLYSICPAVFGPAVACQLRVEGTGAQERVTLHCKCQLDVVAATQPQDVPPDVPDIPTDTHDDAETGGAPSSPAQKAAETAQDADVPAQAGAEAAACTDKDSTPTLEASHHAEEAQLQGEDSVGGKLPSGVVEEGSVTGAVCESGAADQAEDAARTPPGLSDAAPEAAPRILPQQAATSGREAAAVSSVPPDSPAVQSDTGREASSRSSERPDACAGAGPAIPTLCPSRVLRGCLHGEVEVQVAGVRVQHPGDEGALLQASLLELHELLHAPDLFLYVVVHVPLELCLQ